MNECVFYQRLSDMLIKLIKAITSYEFTMIDVATLCAYGQCEIPSFVKLSFITV